jgi:hypothetical protein
MGFPYDDFTRGFEFEEASAGADAAEVNSVPGADFPNFNSIPSITGKFSNARGPLKATGHASPAWFTRSTLSDAGWDIRGDVSMAVSFWVKVPDPSDGAPFAVSIHDPSTEEGQAFILHPYHTSNGNSVPTFLMLDGVTSFNAKQTFHATAPVVPTNAWYYVGASYDKVSDEIRLFYGRQVGESYYSTTAGFAGGFGYDGTGLGAGEGVHIGRYDGLSQDSLINIDQLLFWNDRALDETDFDNIWNGGSGIATADLDTDPNPGSTDGVDAESIHYRFLRRKARYGR